MSLISKKIITETVDDFDGASGAAPYSFALNGVFYDIDLTPDNAKKLEAVLAPYIEHARRSDAVRLMRVTKLPRGAR